MTRLVTNMLCIILACFVSSWARADVPSQTPLYGITPGTNLKTLEATFGKPSERIPFDDGWVAFVYEFEKHSLIVEIAPDDPEYVIGVQIDGESNPEDKGLLNINLGDDIKKVLTAFGPPADRTPSVDEKTKKTIPNLYTYQYENASFEVFKDKIVSIKVSFEKRGALNFVPHTGIKPVGLLNYTYESWQILVGKKYNCTSARVISAQPNPVSTKGVISERWQTDVCGQEKIFVPSLVPDDKGGYRVSFGEENI